MSSILHEKPMSKRSNLSRESTESLRWWKEGVSSYGEWAYEGGPEHLVGTDGNSNRYDESICLYVKYRVGGFAEFMASVPLGTGAFYFLMKGAGYMDADWWWCG